MTAYHSIVAIEGEMQMMGKHGDIVTRSPALSKYIWTTASENAAGSRGAAIFRLRVLIRVPLKEDDQISG